MVQVLPRQPSTGDLVLERLRRSSKNYFDAKEAAEKKSAIGKLADPNTSDIEKSKILGIYGDISDVLKFDKTRRTTNLIDEYKNLDSVGRLDDGRSGQPDAAASSGLGNAPTDNFVGPKLPGVEPPSAAGNAPTQPNGPVSKFSDNMPKENPKADQRQKKQDLILGLAQDNPALANVLQKREIAQENREHQNTLEDRRERLKHHESFKDFDSELSSNAKAARNRLHAYDEIEERLKTGNLNPTKLGNFLANKYAGTQWEGIFTNSDREKVKAASIFMLDGLRDLFGGQLTDSKLQVASGKVVDPTKRPEANQAIIDFRRFYDEAAVTEREIGDEITKENGGYRPIDYEAQVRQRLNERLAPEANRKMNLVLSDGLTSQDSVVMTAPNGNDYNVPTDQIEKYLQAGGKIKNG